MPFVIAFAIAFHVLIIAPLYLMDLQRSQLALEPAALLQWPLATAFGVSVALGLVLMVLARRGWGRAVAIAAALGIYLYLQFYVVVWNFGPFDGRIISFADYKLQAALEIALILALIGSALKWPAVTTPLYGRLLGMLLLLSGAFIGWQFANAEPAPAPQAKGTTPPSPVASANFFRDAKMLPDVTKFSKDKNVVVLLLDTLQSDVFENVVSNDPVLRKQFAGFVLYPNASSHFPFTGLSMPSILTGEPYKDLTEKIPDYRARVAPKRVEAVLAARGFQASRIPLHNRADFLSETTVVCRSYGAVYDLYGFRQLPIALKPWFYDHGKFRIARQCSNVPPSDAETDIAVFSRLRGEMSADAGAPTVKYFHFWGAHPPGMVTADCRPQTETSTLKDFQGQATCALRQAGEFLDKMRSLGVFDNTLLFIISDHGSRYGFLQKRGGKAGAPAYVMSAATPSIAFHDFNDKGEFRLNHAPVMLADVHATILSALGDTTETFGRDVRKVAEGEQRQRTFLFFRNAGDASGDFLSKIDRFVINGDVRDPAAWSPLVEGASAQAAPLAAIDFGKPTISNYLGLGWSAEAKGVAQSWVLASPAYLSGRFPEGRRFRMTIDLLNPHKDQTVSVKLNGRDLAEWKFPDPVSWTEKTIDIELRPEELGKAATLEFEVTQLGDNARGIAVRAIKLEANEGH
ncbi:sulfatase-like hydrolase/transferase [Microvirga flavescens]|uniref:sulfatase-like hydrolase/transferase n=1 Tax=Microvirga flavescens TaxID=2249811 RepID=UPI000DD92DB9|nr:sulfatase-like hydrolase/transferase [Microvirga flavescens]